MRTTVDIDARILERAKQLARAEGRTLGALVSDALSAYLGAKRSAAKDARFQLLVRGDPSARFPSAEEVRAVEEDEDAASLGIPQVRRNAAS
ncbi:MAG: hypothetical protein KC776_00815 [Myxococcales bacterium]|nr:hypothetical protein [Myxococcales bacterium]MCB9578986.1 hypothetical protein [Polyangiaceae bacterium]